MELKQEQEFKEKCKKELPEFISVDGVNYKLNAYGLLDGGFKIVYIQFDGKSHGDNQLFNLLYEIVDIMPEEKEVYGDVKKHDTIYKKNMDEIISDVISKLQFMKCEKLDEIVTEETMFNRELTSLLNKYSKENSSNTPDYVLSSYLIGCLKNYNHTISLKTKHNN